MANTNKGRKFYICTTPQATDLTQEQYEALTWVEVGNVGSIGETGTNTNIVSYDELSTETLQKQKGISNAGDPPVECARNDTDAGQIAMRAAAATKYFYATKTEDNDAPSADYTNSIYYNRGLITGPVRPNGRNEDFILEVFTLGLVQKEIVVGPEATVAPTNTVLPAISGLAATGEDLIAYPGIWTGRPTLTYQWQADDAGNGTFTDISGATSSTFTAVVGNEGDALRVEVTGVNGEGTPVVAYSAPTQLQTS